MIAERPCHEAEGDLLSVHPVGTCVGRVVLCPVFDESPEGFGVFFIVRGGVGTDEGVDEGEAVGFPDEFDVGGGVVGDLRPVFHPTVTEGAVLGSDVWAGSTRSFAERSGCVE